MGDRCRELGEERLWERVVWGEDSEGPVRRRNDVGQGPEE